MDEMLNMSQNVKWDRSKWKPRDLPPPQPETVLDFSRPQARNKKQKVDEYRDRYKTINKSTWWREERHGFFTAKSSTHCASISLGPPLPYRICSTFSPETTSSHRLVFKFRHKQIICRSHNAYKLLNWHLTRHE
ncbi:hypothetical protein YC2023_075704 [Brassica napus]